MPIGPNRSPSANRGAAPCGVMTPGPQPRRGDMFETDSTLIASPTRRGSDAPPDDPGVGTIDAGDELEALHETIIRPQAGWVGIDWWEMWSHRELLVFLVKRDISVRYKQTILGPAWA